jgi:diadenosine tetraphosphatase ApaH/serine/threonine PP2A family protein phosphatase
VHGSARNPLNEYVFPDDIYNQRKMERIFGLVSKYCFQGHTHVPGVFTESLRFLRPEECDFRYSLGQEKLLINVGSVGQPRNGDPRSSYVILDDSGQVVFQRVPYDVESTRAKILAIPELDNYLGDRLLDGR